MKSPFHTRIIGLIVVFAFVFASAFKLAVFNRLIIDAPLLTDVFAGFGAKFFVVSLLIVACTFSKRPVFFIVFYCLQLIYLFVNLSYYLNFQGYLHVNQYFGLISEAIDLVKYSAIPHNNKLFWLLLDVPFAIAFVVFYGSVVAFFAKNRGRLLLCGVLLGLYFFVKRFDPMQDSAESFMKDAYSSDKYVVTRSGLFAFNIVDILNYKDAKQHIKRISYGVVHTHTDTLPVHPNIIMIQVESLDAFIVNTKYKKKYVTPFLHSLSQSCVFYPYMLSYHEAGSTSDCEFSTINSIEPFNDYPAMKIRNYDFENSMLLRFNKGNYSCNAFHGNRGTYFNRTPAFAKMGFEKFYDMFGMGLKEINWGVSDEAVFDFAKNMLFFQRKPFLYYIITMSSHEPFTLTDPYYTNNVFATIKNATTRRYYNSLSYVDKELKEFVESVRAANPNTYFFIYGDHTPIIPKDVYKRATFLATDRLFEFVPLFIVTPDAKVYREQRLVASFVDIAPTALAASGIKFTIRSHGNDLLKQPLLNGNVIYRDSMFSRAGLYSRIKKEYKVGF